MSQASATAWMDYYQKTKGRPLRPLYLESVSLLPAGALTALDVGCGGGAETIDLLQRGFWVHAIDREMQAIEFTRARAKAVSPRLTTAVTAIESILEWPKSDFVFAYHSLPFVLYDLTQVVERLRSAIRPGGIFAGTFFGPEDDWSKQNEITSATVAQLEVQFTDFEILHLKELLYQGESAMNGTKNWHIIELIARSIM